MQPWAREAGRAQISVVCRDSGPGVMVNDFQEVEDAHGIEEKLLAHEE